MGNGTGGARGGIVREVRFDGSFAGWRAQARALLTAQVAPEQVLWRADHSPQPFLALATEREPEPAEGAREIRVPRAFFELTEAVACHRDPERWALLYRVVWRLARGERHLLEVSTDPDVHRLLAMEKAVRRDIHKMKAFVRFREVEQEDISCFVAWFEPEHSIVERTAPFFARRFASMQWSILTPRGCAHWDTQALTFSDPVAREQAPREDALEELWRTYYAHIFNPARVNPRAMRSEMPKKFWKNLPEARLVGELVRDAPARVRRMVREQSGG